MSANIRGPKIRQHCGTEFIAEATLTKFYGDTCAKCASKKRKRDQTIQEIAPTPVQKQEYNLEQVRDKNFLSIVETCKLFGEIRMALYRQIQNGKIQATKIGSRTNIKRGEIENLFQA